MTNKQYHDTVQRIMHSQYLSSISLPL